MHQFLIVTPGFSRWKHIFSKGFYFSRLLCPAHKIWHTYDNPGAMCSALFQLKRQKRKQQHVPWIIRMYVYIFLINVQWTHYNFFFYFSTLYKKYIWEIRIIFSTQDILFAFVFITLAPRLCVSLLLVHQIASLFLDFFRSF